MITPTVARLVHYRPTADEVGEHGLTMDGNKPLAAVVAFVHSDSEVNLAVFDARGDVHGRQNVVLVQDDGPVLEGDALWMPFQKGQAAKTDEVTPRVAALEEKVAAFEAAEQKLAELTAQATASIDAWQQKLAALAKPAETPPA